MNMQSINGQTRRKRVDLFGRVPFVRRLILLAILAMLVLLAVVGVSWRWHIYVPESARGVWRRVSDATITGQVKAAFALSKRISAYDISVDTRDGVVTLTGQAPSEIDRELAGDVAKDTTGVKQVDNQIKVEPGLQPSEASRRESSRVADLEIYADLREKLAAGQIFAGNQIQVSVKDRVVTFAGQAQTPQQKAAAEQLARSAPNVAGVVNQLSVANQAAQTETPGVSDRESKDQELANQVLFAIFNERDNFSNVGAIKVENRNGNVTLTGTVASRAERALAERVARAVKGVSAVSNRLSVASKSGNYKSRDGAA
jgi:hyperosmotically inducible protein